MFNRTEQIKVYPTNRSSGSFSYSRGNPIIRFNITNKSGYLMPDSLALCYKITVVRSSADVGKTNPTPAERRKNANVAVPPPPGLPSYIVNTDATCGMVPIEHLFIKSALSATSIETIRNYNRLLASQNATLKSFNDLTCNSNMRDGAYSGNADRQSSVVNRTSSICHKLRTGFLAPSSRPIPLRTVGGINLELHLMSDSNFLYGKDAATGGGSSYFISDVNIMGTVAYRDGEEDPSEDVHSFLSYVSLYNVLRSNDDTIGYTMANSGVLSNFSNCVPVSWTNNYGENSQAIALLNKGAGGAYDTDVVSTRVTFLKNNVKYPLLYQLDASRFQDTDANAPADPYVNTGYFSEKNRYFLEAMRIMPRMGNMLEDPISEGLEAGTQTEGETTTPAILATATNTKGHYNESNFHYDSATKKYKQSIGKGSFGIRYDGVGVSSSEDFKNQHWGMRTVSTLDGVSPNSLYSFFLTKQALNSRLGQVVVVN